MSTLHIDLKLGLSVDRTRTLLGEYSRGCRTQEVIYTPKIEFTPGEERYFNITDSNVFIFLSDYFGIEKPFSVTFIKNDNSVIELKECNVLMIECSDMKAVKITNTCDKIYRAHIIR